MGLLNFISKKSSHSELPKHGSLKTRAYNETVASRPPIRGTYPVLGNGAKILEEFQRSHPNLATISRNNTPIPATLAPGPRYRGPGVDRPRTAPSSQIGNTSNTLSSQSQPLKKKKYGPYKLPSKLVTDIRDPSALERPAASPGLVSLYSDSVKSSEAGKSKGYVDLLDAQSMFKPSDFYSRVQAAGAKNYGEDVADRNRELISTNLDTRGSDTMQSHAAGYGYPLVSQDVDGDDSHDEPPRPRKVRNSTSSSRRPKSIGPHTPGSFPQRTSSRLPPQHADEAPKVLTRTESARSERAARRKSMPSYLASTPAEAPRSSSAVRKNKVNDPNPFPNSLRSHARSSTTYEREHAKPNISSKRQSLAPSRDGHSSFQPSNDLDKPLPALPTSRNHSRRRTTAHNNTVVESRLLEKRQSLRGATSASRGEIYEDTYQQKKSLQATRPASGRNSSRRQLGSTTDLQDFSYSSPAQQPDHESQIITPSTNHVDIHNHKSRSNHARNQSIISISNKGIPVAHEAGNIVPERSSSLRHWSLTSETAFSTLSSNPFRPQSGHTTNTSVDFSPLIPQAHLNESIPPIPDVSFLKSLQSIPDNTSTILSPCRSLPNPYKRQSSEFFLDEHASDVGSSLGTSRGSYERDLLFSPTEYGVSGDQSSGLPGLFDVAVPASPVGLSINQTWEGEAQRVPRQFQMPAYIESDSNDFVENQYPEYSSEEEINFDIPKSRASSALRYTPATEKLPTKTLPLEEEDESDH
ncbi:hypothetical protein F5B22DRAFT_619541 [Xylaria bambusicola]|uniref:uncharacterized protein n=1 Tax=Xylaria bambusicola TaxID=326684 RepID=UPI0020084A55|nr:uncharacterized protein F5B22DRAFT_619541 [Xylaria bambusicola]KAI0508771.1 hypothetical protein F5B22DRAFT_619541 [Xylaria bambusicola]